MKAIVETGVEELQGFLSAKRTSWPSPSLVGVGENNR